MDEKNRSKGIYERYIKRLLDVIFSMIFLIMFWWLYVIIALLIRIKLGAPILFYQERIGVGERPFKLFKFRSMSDEKDEDGNFLPDEMRLTNFGAKLRSSSLDELPEIISILKGDMSIVGPRPMPYTYLKYFKDEERIIHTVKGGLLPPDVLTGHSVFDWDEQFRNEMEYARNISFVMDCKIFFATFTIMFKRSKESYGEKIRKSLNEVRKV